MALVELYSESVSLAVTESPVSVTHYLFGEVIPKISAESSIGDLIDLDSEVIANILTEGMASFSKLLAGEAVLLVSQDSKVNVDWGLFSEAIPNVCAEGRLFQQYQLDIEPGENFILSGSPKIGGGLSITWLTGESEIPTYWYLVGINQSTGQEEEPHGSLKWTLVKTDKTGRALNYYVSPKGSGLVGHIDRVIIRKLSS
jgi:hypothetical protein